VQVTLELAESPVLGEESEFSLSLQPARAQTEENARNNAHNDVHFFKFAIIISPMINRL
jgi:hypothetical protein